MNWEAIGAIGELIGALVVVVSVLYLAVQVRQNTNQAKLSAAQAINASNDSAFNPIYIPENALIFAKGQQSLDSLDEHETVIFHMLMSRLLGSINTTSYQYHQGMYDDEIYENTLKFYKDLFSTPGGRAWFNANRHLFSAETVNRLDDAADSNT